MKYLKVLIVALLATFTFATSSNAQVRVGVRLGGHPYHHRRVVVVHRPYHHRVVVVHRYHRY